ncbi:MAG: O-antigen ligase family protein [Verrucomicrobia bacterium]|nr:O-antigen ligase family protein [Verrucomicrobiota bacterium]
MTTTWLTRTLHGALWTLVFLLPVKFGGLALLPEHPANLDDWIFSRWPLEVAVVTAFVWAAVAAVAAWRERGVALGGWAWLALVWFAVQWLSACVSPWPERAWSVAAFFSVATVFFFIGWWPAENERRYRSVLGALVVATVVVCVVALHQHFGGFEEALRYAREHPESVPPEVRAHLAAIEGKLAQGRVFGTLFYSNTLAGYLILVAAPACWWLWRFLRERMEGGERAVRVTCAVLTAAFAALVLGCLLLTRSKGGFAALALALVGGLALCRQVNWRWRAGIMVALLAVGAVFFGVQGFRRGAETLEARGDYWRAGVAMIVEQPWIGGGPGTFGKRYVERRRPDAEPTRLAHNNFLQQWTDSGIIGFSSFTALWIGTLWLGARRLRSGPFDPLTWATWTSLAAWTLHNLVDFDLYVAAVAWPAFLMAGWMLRNDAAAG